MLREMIVEFSCPCTKIDSSDETKVQKTNFESK